jgi:hypothetical protein
MSDSSHSLVPFRLMVSAGLVAGDTFKKIVRDIADEMKTHQNRSNFNILSIKKRIWCMS